MFLEKSELCNFVKPCNNSLCNSLSLTRALSSFNKVESENSNIENNNYSVLEEPVDEVNNNESSPKIVMEKAEDALKVDDDIWKL